jgi:hypothetical protein
MGVVLHPAQSRIFGDLMVKRKYRHIAAACARGFGKSYCAAAIGVAGATGDRETRNGPVGNPKTEVAATVSQNSPRSTWKPHS